MTEVNEEQKEDIKLPKCKNLTINASPKYKLHKISLSRIAIARKQYSN